MSSNANAHPYTQGRTLPQGPKVLRVPRQLLPGMGRGWRRDDGQAAGRRPAWAPGAVGRGLLPGTQLCQVATTAANHLADSSRLRAQPDLSARGPGARRAVRQPCVHTAQSCSREHVPQPPTPLEDPPRSQQSRGFFKKLTANACYKQNNTTMHGFQICLFQNSLI